MTNHSRKRLFRSGLRRTVFWQVAFILVGVQLLTGLAAVSLSAWFANERSLDLATNSLRVQLDRLAEEIEQRAFPLADGLSTLPVLLEHDLALRFPDPIFLLDADGRPIRTIYPDSSVFSAFRQESDGEYFLPDSLAQWLMEDDIVVQMVEGRGTGTWGLAPIYDADGFIAGGLLIQPLTNTINMELAGTRKAYNRAMLVVALLGGCIALLLGALFTWRLVRPLRSITHEVERIGSGDYEARVGEDREDEIGRLAAAVNQMALDVQKSVDTLRSTDRLRRELVANIGHDLRTPLTAFLGYVEEAGRHLDEGDNREANEALSSARKQGMYLTQLVSDLFELSLLDSAPSPLRREPIPVGELLHDAVNVHRTAFSEKHVSLHLRLSAPLPVIEGDGVRLLRVLDNLLSNALQYTPEGGDVNLVAGVRDEWIEIQVEDTGDGMDEETVTLIFDRYYRGQEARTRQSGGTGLGLPISKAIARAHGGDLTVQSTPGAGSVFSLRLPVNATLDEIS